MSEYRYFCESGSRWSEESAFMVPNDEEAESENGGGPGRGA